MKKILLGILIIFSTYLWSTDDQEKKISVFTIEVMPFGLYRNKKPVGLYFDYANKIIETAGYYPNNKIVPFARAHDEVVAGNVEMTIMFDTKELLKEASQSTSVLEFENLVIPAKGKKITKLSDLNNLRVGAIRSGCYDIKSQNNINPKIIEFNDYSQGIKLLQSSRIDAICGSLIPMKFSAREMGIKNNFFDHAFVASKREAHVHFSKNIDPAKLKRLNLAIERLKKEQYFEKMAKKLDY